MGRTATDSPAYHPRLCARARRRERGQSICPPSCGRRVAGLRATGERVARRQERASVLDRCGAAAALNKAPLAPRVSLRTGRREPARLVDDVVGEREAVGWRAPGGWPSADGLSGLLPCSLPQRGRWCRGRQANASRRLSVSETSMSGRPAVTETAGLLHLLQLAPPAAAEASDGYSVRGFTSA